MHTMSAAVFTALMFSALCRNIMLISTLYYKYYHEVTCTGWNITEWQAV